MTNRSESSDKTPFEPTEVLVKWGIDVPLRDGTQLSAILYVPEKRADPLPAIVTLTPYIAQSHHVYAAYFASHGYAFLSVDVRGRGNSAGTFDPRNEARDGYDVVEWLAKQEFCSGKVAMWGGSYLGFCQWAVAGERPPHLTTIVPTAAACYGVDVPARNAIFEPYIVRWFGLIAGRALQDKMFTDRPYWNRRYKQWFELGGAFKNFHEWLGVQSPLFQEWLAHPEQGEYWDGYSPSEQEYAALDIPVLTITGAYDGDQPGALEHYRRHLRGSAYARANHYLIIGPWDHHGTTAPKAEFCGLKFEAASVLDLSRLHLEWYAWVIHGGPRPEFLQRSVAYYVAGAERWRYADTLEGITARHEPFYLHSVVNPTDVFAAGSLTRELSGAATPDQYCYDPRDVSLAELESTVDTQNLVDQRMVHAARGKHLVYHSEPFDKDTEISGFFRLTLWLAIDQPDTDFQVAIYEIGIDGGAIRLTTDWMRARYRMGLREARSAGTCQPLKYDFQRFTFISRQVRKGHRLRLVIGPVNSIFAQKNYNGGGDVSEESMADARAVTVKLYHDAERPSALYIPIGQAQSV